MSRPTSVIQEGGLGGHMNHLYDDPDLSFGEMKEIFLAAASGELEGTQKVDGQNIFLSYSLARGQAIAARNKTHLKAGGMGAAELAKFFDGRGSLQKAFMDGFQAFEEAVSTTVDKDLLHAESVLDLMEMQDDLIYQTKKQCALVEVKSTARGTQTFDLPLHLKKSTSATRARKDNYTTLMLANWALKSYYDMKSTPNEIGDTFTPRMIH